MYFDPRNIWFYKFTKIYQNYRCTCCIQKPWPLIIFLYPDPYAIHEIAPLSCSIVQGSLKAEAITDTTFRLCPKILLCHKEGNPFPSSLPRRVSLRKNIGRMRAACILFHRKKKKKRRKKPRLSRKCSDTRCAPFNRTSRCLLSFMLLFCIRHRYAWLALPL